MKHSGSVNILDTYFSLLEHLSTENKLELISKLADSIKSTPKTFEKNWREKLSGFVPEKSAEEIIDDLKEARFFNRKTEDFD
jgi:hypothetical protein